MKRLFNGFTLIELLVVIGIIALLATAGMASYRSANMRSRNARRQSDLESVRAALEMYRTDEGCYAPYEMTSGCTLISGESNSWVDMTDVLNTGGYLAKIPTDPLSGQSYTYSSDGSKYELCAVLENTSTDTCTFASSPYNYGVVNP